MDRKPKLILIEGASGLGKSTAVANLAKAWSDRSPSKAIFCDEYNHPLHAFWTWGDGYDTAQIIEEPFSASKFKVRLLARTFDFVDRLIAEKTDAVVETYPFQSPVRNMLKMLATKEDCFDYFRRFCDAISDCDPLLVYFDHPAWNQRIRQILKDRGPQIESYFLNAYHRSPWGRAHESQTLQDVFGFYEEYFHLCDQLLKSWPYPLLRFDPIQLGTQATTDRILNQIFRP